MNLIPGKSSASRPTPSKKSSSLCKLEVRPDSDYVVLRGQPGQAEAQLLKGRVILMTTEQIEIKSICVVLWGKWRTTHSITMDELDAGIRHTPWTIYSTGVNVKYIQEIVKEERKLAPSNYEFPFEFEIPGVLPESFEGISTKPVYQIYMISAVAYRGFFHKDLSAERHLRIIRTIGSDVEELIDPTGVTGCWVDKIKYEWSAVSKAVCYGDTITVDFKLTPLTEKLEIGKIRFWVEELLMTRTYPGIEDFPETTMKGPFWKEYSECAKQEKELPSDVTDDLDEELQLPRKKFSLTFQLEKSLRNCRQTIGIGERIQTRHHMYISIQIHNPDGHISELRARSALKIYISPHLQIDQDLTVTTPVVNLPSSVPLDSLTTFPPGYGSHTTDIPLNPFEEIHPSGFVTPAALGSRSGTTTPGRSNAILTSDDANAQELLARLETLRNQYLERDNDQQISETGLAEGSALHLEYDMEELGRVPTYNTAINNPGPATYGNGPPTYAAATSRPPSPLPTTSSSSRSSEV